MLVFEIFNSMKKLSLFCNKSPKRSLHLLNYLECFEFNKILYMYVTLTQSVSVTFHDLTHDNGYKINVIRYIYTQIGQNR